MLVEESKRSFCHQQSVYPQAEPAIPCENPQRLPFLMVLRIKLELLKKNTTMKFVKTVIQLLGFGSIPHTLFTCPHLIIIPKSPNFLTDEWVLKITPSRHQFQAKENTSSAKEKPKSKETSIIQKKIEEYELHDMLEALQERTKNLELKKKLEEINEKLELRKRYSQLLDLVEHLKNKIEETGVPQKIVDNVRVVKKEPVQEVKKLESKDLKSQNTNKDLE